MKIVYGQNACFFSNAVLFSLFCRFPPCFPATSQPASPTPFASPRQRRIDPAAKHDIIIPYGFSSDYFFTDSEYQGVFIGAE